MQPLHGNFQKPPEIPNFAPKSRERCATAPIDPTKPIHPINMKKEIETKKTLARSLYLSGMELGEIADQVDISRQSVSRWCADGGWKEARAAKNISRPELVNKLLLAIDNLIAQVNASGDPEAIGTLADKLSKLSATIEKLDKKANVVDAIEVFMAFNRWIQDRASYDPDITPELVKAINKYQNQFLMEKMSTPSTL